MKSKIFFILLVYCSFGEAAIGSGRDISRCQIERALNIVGYDCSNRNLREIPILLDPEVKALDASSNRIRRLNEISFVMYTKIKYLLLFDNLIHTIGPNTFSKMVNLEAIDLSGNGLTTLPMELFCLPRLRKILASTNPLSNLHEDLKNVSKPIAAPLQLIAIANSTLSKVPDFGVLPSLYLLNISSNNLLDITPQQFVPFCSLKILDMSNATIPPCPCQALRNYVTTRSIDLKMNGAECDDSAEDVIICSDVDSDSYEGCA